MSRLAKARSWYEKQLKMSTILEDEDFDEEDEEDDAASDY